MRFQSKTSTGTTRLLFSGYKKWVELTLAVVVAPKDLIAVLQMRVEAICRTNSKTFGKYESFTCWYRAQLYKCHLDFRAGDVILDQYHNSPALMCDQGVKTCTLSLIKKVKWAHCELDQGAHLPLSSSLCQIREMSLPPPPQPCKIEKQMSHGISPVRQCLLKFTGASLRSPVGAKWGKRGL